MLKVPYSRINNRRSTVSEYLGCHIFNLLGIKAQETILGIYRYKDKVKYAVACIDITSKDEEFMEFTAIKKNKQYLINHILMIKNMMGF